MRSNQYVTKYEKFFVMRMLRDCCPRSRVDLPDSVDANTLKPRSLTEWRGGVESELFNFFENRTALAEPVLPALGGRLSRCYTAPISADTFTTTRCNWLIQSSAVDFLHIFMTNLEYLLAEYEINAAYSLSIHDMIQYICAEEDKYRCVLAFQLAHLYTRVYFTLKCGFTQLPQNCAFFSSVEVDRVMGRSPGLKIDPIFDPAGSLPDLESLNINDVILKTNGSLQK